jgi:hypothetical protein
MLNDKEFFTQAVDILRRRNFFDNNIWSFGLFHKDPKSTLEYIEANRGEKLRTADVPLFEYFPYFSRRTHKFSDENKSTIRNVQFKETYNRFLVNILLEGLFSSV